MLILQTLHNFLNCVLFISRVPNLQFLCNCLDIFIRQIIYWYRRLFNYLLNKFFLCFWSNSNIQLIAKSFQIWHQCLYELKVGVIFLISLFLLVVLKQQSGTSKSLLRRILLLSEVGWNESRFWRIVNAVFKEKQTNSCCPHWPNSRVSMEEDDEIEM